MKVNNQVMHRYGENKLNNRKEIPRITLNILNSFLIWSLNYFKLSKELEAWILLSVFFYRCENGRDTWRFVSLLKLDVIFRVFIKWRYWHYIYILYLGIVFLYLWYRSFFSKVVVTTKMYENHSSFLVLSKHSKY